MNAQLVLSFPQTIHVLEVQVDHTILQVTAVSTQPTPRCPCCDTPSVRVHSRYTRTLLSLPCTGRHVRISLRTRKCFCDQPSCPRKIFAERLPTFAAPWARVTQPCAHLVQVVGLATGGRPGQRLLVHLGMPTSRTTIVRRMMALAPASHHRVTQVGIDDFAFRRGRVYGTIIVDLETHTVIDLLPDRSRETTAAWLRQHPDITLISRDRGGDYAAAARQAAPQAIQVADRFHLMHNLVAVATAVLARCRVEIRHHMTPAVTLDQDAPRFPVQWTSQEQWRQAPAVADEQRAHHRRSQRLDRYDQVATFHRQGATYQDIAKRTGLSVTTIGYWIRSGAFPERKQREREGSPFDPYAAFVLARWESGCHNGRQLHQEITAMGFTGSSRMVHRFLVPLRKTNRIMRQPLAPPGPFGMFSAQQGVWLFVRAPGDLTPDEHEMLTVVCQASPTAAHLYDLVQGFRQLVHRQEGRSFDDWCRQVEQSAIGELQRFVRGLTRDDAAVRAGLTQATNNGMVEGFVTKLKLIKRMMFGRAKFPLLRQRVLNME